MKLARIAVIALAMGATTFVTSCGDAPLAPEAPLHAPAVDGKLLGSLGGTLGGTLGNTLNTIGAMTCSPLRAATSSEYIGPWGGVIEVGPHRLVIPPGALKRYVRITATIRPENVNRVQLEPTGLQFERPAYLTMSYANCTGAGTLLPKQIAHVEHGGLGLLGLLQSFDNIFAKKVTGRLDHFSDYAVWWRSGSSQDDEMSTGDDH